MNGVVRNAYLHASRQIPVVNDNTNKSIQISRKGTLTGCERISFGLGECRRTVSVARKRWLGGAGSAVHLEIWSVFWCASVREYFDRQIEMSPIPIDFVFQNTKQTPK